MSRKLSKKLNNTIQREDEEAGVGGRGGYNQSQNTRRGNPPSQQPAYEAEDDLEEASNPLQRESTYGYDASNPFTYYDRQNHSRGPSSERIQAQEGSARARGPTTNSPRLGASILRTPSIGTLKELPPQEERWAASAQEEEDDEDYVTEDDEGEDDIEESNSAHRIPHGRGSKPDMKEKQGNPKKPNGSASSGSQKVQKVVKKQPTPVLRKSSSKAKELNQSQPKATEGSSRRSRTHLQGSGTSLNGNGSYVSSSSNSRLNRTGSVGGSSNQHVNRHELMPLEIEIPDTVTDVDTFRRYLSVRRGAVGPQTYAPFPTFEDPHSDSVAESLAGGGPHYGTSKTKHLNTPGGLAGAAASSLLVQRKSMALSHAIMTLALLSASASQLRFVVAYSNAHSYPALNYFLICSCIFVEILVGIGYVIISRFEFSERTLDKTNTYLIFGLFFVAIANVIIASFALDDHVCEVLAVLAKQKERERMEQFDTLDNSQSALNAHQQIT